MVKKQLLIFLLMAYLLMFSDIYLQAINEKGFKTVVIDAGHGGKDPGCVSRTSKEKDIALSIALKLGDLIKSTFSDVKVIYTRNKDEFIELFRRAEIANENKADLFISIHCNASKSRTPYGSETFVMGIHKNESNLEVAKKENEAILLEDNYKSKYEGFDPNSPESNIIFSLYQQEFLDQSLNLSTLIQKNFSVKANRFDRGVKQAGFLVLHKTTMPGVLIEVGFLSNPEEEKFLTSQKGQNLISQSIFNAFKQYKKNYDKSYTNNKLPEKPKENVIVKNKVQQNNNTSSNINNSQNIIKQNNVSDTSEMTINDIVFKIQILSSSNKIALDASIFSGLQDITEYLENGVFKYTVGNEKELQDAITLQKQIVSGGFKDAFIVVYNNGVRISVDQALSIIRGE
ncbi:MAG: hypothetical protein A2X12_00980 [Bacteroidetes bacterium GWE2_29_8]|nr:MAG: hypothetical protein A2X12_00980 [Bacteroidetes bacterium GWE2_29_8]OFY15128.1 MAG: hypothetical protein A2X02_06520 [Bacteroidetes bacterium GWF2_29_10]